MGIKKNEWKWKLHDLTMLGNENYKAKQLARPKE